MNTEFGAFADLTFEVRNVCYPQNSETQTEYVVLQIRVPTDSVKGTKISRALKLKKRMRQRSYTNVR